MQIIKQEPGFPPKRMLHGGLNLSRLALPGAETKQGHLGSGAQGQRGVHLAFGDGVDLEPGVRGVADDYHAAAAAYKMYSRIRCCDNNFN